MLDISPPSTVVGSLGSRDTVNDRLLYLDLYFSSLSIFRCRLHIIQTTTIISITIVNINTAIGVAA